MTPITLVIGASAATREAAIASRLDSTTSTAVIIEGLPHGSTALDPNLHPSAQIARIAPGCLCCTGNLVLRVTLNRMLRQQPAAIFISLASSEHIEQLCVSLQEAPYDGLLTLQPVLDAATAT